MIVCPELVKAGAGMLMSNKLPVDDTEAPGAAVVVTAMVGVIFGALLIIVPEVMLMPEPAV